MCCGGWRPNCSSASASARSEWPPRQVELATMNGDERDREVVLRHLEPVLERDVERAGGELGRERPASGPELDPRQAPERAGAARLVALGRVPELALEPGACLLPPRDGANACTTTNVASCTSRSPPSAFAKSSARSRQLGRVAVADDPAENRLHDAGARSEHVVVEPVGELERRPRVLERADVALRKRVAQASRQWISAWSAETRRPPRPAPPRAAGRRADALELGQEDESVGAQRAVLRHAPGASSAIVRARVHSPAACSAGAAVRAGADAIAALRRGQPERLLGELGRNRRRAALGRRRHGGVELGATSASGSASTAPGGAHGGADRRRAPRSAGGRPPARRPGLRTGRWPAAGG